MPNESPPLLDRLDLIRLISGDVDTVECAMATCTIDVARGKIFLQTLHHRPAWIGVLAFLNSWSEVQPLLAARVQVPASVAVRATMLASIADHFAEKMADETASLG